jgi:branched-chain amino acid transport system ATP-binding protein
MTATGPLSPQATPAHAATEPMLVLQDVNTFYGNIHALRNISLTVGRGEIVTLIGANGAGKTTTLKTISGLLHPRRGTVHFEGKDITWFGRGSAMRRRDAASSPG